MSDLSGEHSVTAPEPAFVAVDWGTTRLRASLVDRSGTVLAEAQSADGVQSVAPGGFAAVLQGACGAWLAAHPSLPVLMAGMVGSRNGWVEAPYVTCPCGPDDLARALTRIEGPQDITVAPGVDVRWPDGAYDVMRGEEVQAFGTGLADGIVCLPGTHSKWVVMEGGRIVRFASFITGELYAAMAGSFIGRLAEAPEDQAGGLAAGLRSAALKGGLGRLLFQARAQVLGGQLDGHAVRPFLSGLLVGQELAGASDLFGPLRTVHLVAGPPQREVYAAAFAERGIAVTIVDPAQASRAGLVRTFSARR